MDIKPFQVLAIDGRHLDAPFPIATKYGLALLYRNSPARKPPATIDPKAFLEICCLDQASLQALKGTAKPVPRFRGAGNSPGACRLSDDKIVVSDNVLHIHDWLGEVGVSVVHHYNWTVTPLGAHSMILDESGDAMMFGKPKPIATKNYPVVSGYGPPLAIGSSILYASDFNTEVTILDAKPWETVLMESLDCGASWRFKSMIHLEAEGQDIPRLRKPFIASTVDDSNLIAILWDDKDNRLFSLISEDFGGTWTTPAYTGIDGRWHSLLRLKDGRILLCYAPLDDEKSVVAVASADGGKTWDESGKLKISGLVKHPEISYIRCAQLEDDSIFLTCAGTITTHKDRIILGARFSI